MPHKQEHVIDFSKNDFKSHIVNKIIKPNYITEIQDFTKHRSMWRKRAMRFETCSKLFIGVGSILSFSSGVYGYQTLSFVSGAVSTLSLVLLQYANFSYKESKKATSDLNILLDNIGIKKIPELTTTVQEDGASFKKAPERFSPTQDNIVSPNVSETHENPLQDKDYKKAIEYERLCITHDFEGLKRIHLEDKYPLTDLVLIETAASKNLEMFKYFLTTGIPHNNCNALFYISQSGLEYIKAFFEKYEWNFTLEEDNYNTPLFGSVISNDINSVKYMYEKVPLIKGKEFEIAYNNKNTEILEFLTLKKE